MTSADDESSDWSDSALPLAGLALALAWMVPISHSWRHMPDMQHAWAVPLLMAYLGWERWGERPAPVTTNRVPTAVWLLTPVICALYLAMRLLLTPFPQWPMLLLAFTLLLAAVTLAFAALGFGAAGVRWVGGPLLLTLSALPVPSAIDNGVFGPLRTKMAQVAAEIANALGMPAIASGTTIRLGAGWVGIDEACGGIRSLQACVMIALFFGEWLRLSVARRLGLLAVGVSAAILGNFGRILFLSLRASSGSAAVAGSHDQAGWVAMAMSLAITAGAGWWWGGCRLPASRLLQQRGRMALRPVAWLAAIIVLLAASEVGTRWWYARGAAARTGVPQWTARFPDTLPSYRADPLAEASRDMLRPDHYVAGTWNARPQLRVSAYYVEWASGQVARSVPFLHNPTVCLPYAGCEMVATLEPFELAWSGGTISFQTHRFHSIGGDLLVAFTIWDTDRNRPLSRPERAASWFTWLGTQWAEVRAAREHQPAQLLAVALPWSEEAVGSMRKSLGEMISSVAR